MSDIEIRGFTAVQRELADKLWNMDTDDQVQRFINGLPRSLKREARVVITMLIAHELDSYMEVSDEVMDYLHSR
jgi:hypothetical protein